MHAVSLKDFNIKQQEQTIRWIYNSDHCLTQAKVEIFRVYQPYSSLRSEKAKGALIIDTTSLEQANQLISKGLLQHFKLMQYKLFHSACNISQCFKCQKYGYTAKYCCLHQHYGYCAATAHFNNKCDI